MDNDEWIYDSVMSEEVNMEEDIGVDDDAFEFNEDNGVDPDAFEENACLIDCSAAFQTDEVFESRDAILKWARTVAFENGFVAVIMRSDTKTGKMGRSSFVLIGCERSGKYRAWKKGFTPSTTSTRKCECPFKLRGKPIPGGQGWMVKLICGNHNHVLAKSFCGHPYAGRINEEEKIIVGDMTRSMVKPRNILLTLKEHNADNVTSLKQVYNARYAYRTRTRGNNTEMQQLMKLLERDMYIHWHRVKDDNVVRDLFWAHPDAVQLSNAYHMVFLIDSTYKTNRYRLPLLDIVGVTPTGMTFSAAFAYLEAERINNVVWALECFRGIFLKTEFIPKVIVTDRDSALMTAVKTVFPDSTNLLCRFHINKNVKARCKTYVRQSHAWDHVMQAWGCLIDCETEKQYDEYLMKFDVACAPWPTFVDYVKDTWLNPHKEKFVTAWTNKVMHFGNTTTNRVESAHSTLKRLLQNSVGDLCTVWDAMNNMIILQHVEIKASLEQSTHVVGHAFKGSLYNRLVGMVSRVALNHIASEYERVRYAGKNPKRCGCVLRTAYGLPCACELAKFVLKSIPVNTVHFFWRRLSFESQDMHELQVTITEEIEAISNRFEKLGLCGKMTIKNKLKQIAYPDLNSMCPPPDKVKTKGAPKKKMTKHERSTRRDPSYFEYVDEFHSMQSSCSTPKQSNASCDVKMQQGMVPMLDEFHPFMQQFILNVTDVKADGNCGYRVIAALLDYGEESWALVRNHLLRELGEWTDGYIALFGGIHRFESIKRSLLVDGMSKVTMDKWMDITDMGHVIASRYNVIVVSLSLKQSITFFPLRSQPPRDPNAHRIVCIGHVFGNHFVQVSLKDNCPLPLTALLWGSHRTSEAQDWPNYYISRMQMYYTHMNVRTEHVDLRDV